MSLLPITHHGFKQITQINPALDLIGGQIKIREIREIILNP
ncbi:hypothetical protein PL11201_670075 [Planktothrix sp. PCC 11201]|nr:hypothetical protein PL11201_670075 [Planktothrix sp. PCC 11201]